MLPSMKYKAHIDGLRALAVVPVVLFHLDVEAMSGGFVGVDIFFVISGYLITTILYNDISVGKYSIFEFYKRRILRILPALAAVLIFISAVSVFMLFPVEQTSVGESLVFSTSFLSNVYFWWSSDYFSAAAETMPLLHTWSLAVEEQFYIVFPPLLYLIWKHFRERLLHVLIFAGVMSFGGCLLVLKLQESAAFYLLPFRAWELLMGAVLSILQTRRSFAPSALLGGVGFVLVVLPVLMLDRESSFPGFNALYPCLGACLLIAFAEGTVIGRVLSLRPVVYVGKASYSFYLWHWPLIVFWKVLFGSDLTVMGVLLLASVSFSIAIISTEFVEKPFRGAWARSLPSGYVMLGGLLTLLVIFMIGLGVRLNMFKTAGAISVPSEVERVVSAANYTEWQDHAKQFRRGECLIGAGDGGITAFKPGVCATIEKDRVNVVLIGDSHAAQYWGAFHELFPDVNVMQVTASGCRFLLSSDGDPNCIQIRDWVFNDFLSSNYVDVVILGGRWYQHELGFVQPTLDYLKDVSRNVILLGPTVEYNGSLPLLLARTMLRGEEFDFAKHLVRGKGQLDLEMRQRAEEEGVSYISVLSSECRADECLLIASDGVPMQFDYGHLTLSGAKEVIEANRKLFNEALYGRLTSTD